MEIYVRVTDDDGLCAWYNCDESNGQCYLFDSVELEHWDTGERVGTPCKSAISAKAAGKYAKMIANWDGAVNPKVKYFRYLRGKLVETKFTKDNKIKS